MQTIPSVELGSLQEKPFGFRIANNREILLNDNLDHNPFRPHRIHFYAVLFVLEGEGYHYIDFKKYAYQPGSMIFISKEQVHAFEKNLERDAYFLLFREEFLARGGEQSKLLQHLSLYNYHLYPPVVQVPEAQLGLLQLLAGKMLQEFNAEDDYLKVELLHAALEIFLCLAERMRKEGKATDTDSPQHRTYFQFQELLKAHIFNNRQVSFYADQLSMSTKTLNRITQQIVGQTAKNYIHDVLIIEIKRLLMNTSLSVKEIGYRSGFEETTNFVKYFKKQTEMTPSEFREQY
ncbi:MAG: helix-turn-helix transcriptional regulator [Bacteroidota bacterium]